MTEASELSDDVAAAIRAIVALDRGTPNLVSDAAREWRRYNKLPEGGDLEGQGRFVTVGTFSTTTDLIKLGEAATALAEKRRRADEERDVTIAREEQRRRDEQEAQRRRDEEQRDRDPARCDLGELRIEVFRVGEDKRPADFPSSNEFHKYRRAQSAERVLALLSADAFAEVTGSDGRLTGRRSRACPVCGTGALVFVASSWECEHVRARCIAGCEHGRVLAAIRAIAKDHEERRVDEAAARREREEEAQRAAVIASLVMDDDAEPIEWLVEGVVPARHITLLIGSQGVGKSMTAESIAQSVATGSEWLGQRARRGRVITVQLEMTSAVDRAYRDRIAAGQGIAIADLREQSLRYPQALRLDDEESVEAFEHILRKAKPDLVVLDSLSRAHAAASENDNAIMGGVMGVLERLRKEHGIAFLVLAHANAAGEARGASAITAAVDLELRLARASKSYEATISLVRHKTRVGGVDALRFRFRGEPGAPLRLELVSDDRRVQRPKLSERAREIVDVVREHGPIGRNRILEAVGGSNRDLGPALDEASTAGAIRQDEHKKWSATDSDDES